MSQTIPSSSEQPASGDSSETNALRAPLTPGTLLLDRYTVVEILASDALSNTYRVAAMQRCVLCHVENDGTAQVCGFCGNTLPPPLTRRVLEMRPPANVTQLSPSTILFNGLSYTFLPDNGDGRAASPTLQFSYGAQTDAGLQRGAAGESNQDAIAAFQLNAQNAAGAPTLGLFMIADGIGGAQAGHKASQLALKFIFNELNANLILPFWNQQSLPDETVRALVHQAVTQANAQLIEWENENALQSGTTLTLALVINERAYVANLGDSRTYRVRDGMLEQITRDHSYIANLVANGVVNSTDVFTHPQRNIILKSLGDPTGNELDLFPENEGAYELQRGDRLLLCSDGLWEMVRDFEINAVLAQESNPRAACAQLVQLANAAGGLDNISVIVVAFDSLQTA
ncbi:MAG: serine/threonine-protein phosphatase [Chloroflexota bacterium]|nr:MAG: serine/threonine-protein phosphatase [Chloroflexota bacterium]